MTTLAQKSADQARVCTAQLDMLSPGEGKGMLQELKSAVAAPEQDVSRAQPWARSEGRG